MQTKPKISVAVAVSRTGAIGKGSDLLFRISDDLKRFKKLTRGHPIIMGRKTYESIGRPLPDRTNIIITHNRDYQAPGCIVVPSLEEAIQTATKKSDLFSDSRSDLEDPGEIFIIGGGEIFKQAIPLVDKIYLTLVESDAQGDVFFPDWRADFTKETFREARVDEKTGLKYTWVDLERELEREYPIEIYSDERIAQFHQNNEEALKSYTFKKQKSAEN